MLHRPLLGWLQRTSIVTQIVISLVAGTTLRPGLARCGRPRRSPGTLFISALKAVAPILVLILVIAAISNQQPGQTTQLKPILGCTWWAP